MKATDIDINFAQHELREIQLREEYGLTYEEAHEITLKEMNMYHPEYEKKLYTKEALDAGDKQLLEE